MIFLNPEDLSPEEFELLVKEWFESCKGELASFQATHRQVKSGHDGDYEIDVAISFEVFGAGSMGSESKDQWGQSRMALT